MPTISVIVPARDAAATLPRTLAALAAQRLDESFEVIVVDDGSRDGTAALAREFGLGPVLEGDGSGPADARNRGAAAAQAPLLAFTDADCFPEPGWLAGGLEALAGAELVQGAVAPDPLVPPGPFDRTLRVASERGLYESANLFVTRELLERLGGFESWLGPAHGKELGEDVWFGWRARRAGARTAFAPAALVYHAVHRRDAAGYVAERWRLRFFPALIARVPELRRRACFARAFLTRRSAAFDLGLGGAIIAAAARNPWPAAAAVPYALLAAREAAPWGRRLAPRVALAAVAADAVGFAALVLGSVRARSPLL